MRMGYLSLLGVLGLMAAGPLAKAATVTYSASIPLTSTNWVGQSLTISQFDPALGVLDSVSFTLNGHVEGTAKFESHDATASEVTSQISATIRIRRPDDNSIIVQVIPLAEQTYQVAAYDGIPDWGGTSGKTYSDFANASDSDTLLSNLGIFLGTGTITLPIGASGASYATGPGNIEQSFATQASASAFVIYNYTPTPIPLPAALPAGLVLLGGVVVAGRMRRKAA